jgi:hypothetical protein
VNKFGEELDLGRLVSIHLERERFSRACLGAHWRMRLAYALRHADRRTFPKELVTRARQRLQEVIRAARGAGAYGLFRVEAGAVDPAGRRRDRGFLITDRSRLGTLASGSRHGMATRGVGR